MFSSFAPYPQGVETHFLHKHLILRAEALRNMPHVLGCVNKPCNAASSKPTAALKARVTPGKDFVTLG